MPAASGPDADSAPTRPGEGVPAPRRVVCPFLRLDADWSLAEPGAAPSEHHRCIAITGPRVVSHQQQELVCLRATHLDCARYRRATSPAASARGRLGAPATSRAVVVALIVLAVSAGLSFGFVLQRGGIDLASPGPAATALANATNRGASAAATAGSPAAVSPAGPPPSSPLAPAPTPSSAPTPSETVAPGPTPSLTPAPTRKPTASTGPSASRLAVLKPCLHRSGCYIYTVRAGDNLFSIAHWFGVPLATIYAWNPTVHQTGIHAGLQLRIPTPTR